MDPDLLALRFEELRQLQDGWDGDAGERLGPCPAPSQLALERAESIARQRIAAGETIDYIDPDVIGGVAIWIGKDWISVMNDGTTTKTVTS